MVASTNMIAIAMMLVGTLWGFFGVGGALVKDQPITLEAVAGFGFAAIAFFARIGMLKWYQFCYYVARGKKPDE
ncbi:hypothetical protein [Erythrobacter westpacificensis]